MNINVRSVCVLNETGLCIHISYFYNNSFCKWGNVGNFFSSWQCFFHQFKITLWLFRSFSGALPSLLTKNGTFPNYRKHSEHLWRFNGSWLTTFFGPGLADGCLQSSRTESWTTVITSSRSCFGRMNVMFYVNTSLKIQSAISFLWNLNSGWFSDHIAATQVSALEMMSPINDQLWIIYKQLMKRLDLKRLVKERLLGAWCSHSLPNLRLLYRIKVFCVKQNDSLNR